MREIRLYGSEGGRAGYSPYPYQPATQDPGFRLPLERRPSQFVCIPVLS